ncbi:zinc-ribbon domain-containing protein [Myxococcota bacterium]|nr:zinc-ribbon domain-containing protein [Myxococcota bacterium]MBU1432016.1 zinc-ribbon domain-containing protein [Myxococcota bacterium]MBU1899617.1 zinc-ribbon domain-containing protein [Myxococcota bacterium]
MKFRCEKCNTRYTIADEKVHRKVLKIRCKNCEHTIVVRDPKMNASKSEVGPRIAEPLDLRGLSRPPEVEWHYAREGASVGPMPFERLRDLIKAGELEADDVLWNEHLGDWTCLSDLPDLFQFMPHAEVDEADTNALPSVGDRPALRDERAGPRRPLLASPQPPAPIEEDETLLQPLFPLDPNMLSARLAPQQATPQPKAAPVFELNKPSARAAPPSQPSAPPLALEPQDSELPLIFPDEEGESLDALPGFESLEALRDESVEMPGFEALKAPTADPHGLDLPHYSPASRSLGKHFVLGFFALLLLGGGVALGIKLAPGQATPIPDAEIAAPAPQDAAPQDAAPQDAGLADAASTPDAQVSKKRGPRRPRPIKDGAPDNATAKPERPSRFSALDRGKKPTVDVTALGGSKGAEALPDALTQQQIMRVIRGSQRGIRACYERQLKRDDSIRSTRTTLRFKIKPDGETTQIKLSKALSGSVLEQCLTGLVGRWRFPAFDGEPQAVEYPIIFQASP